MRKKYSLTLILIFAANLSYCDNEEKLSLYMYEDTRQLVSLVEDAATLIEEKGEEAFKDFSVKNSKWFNDKYYLFVYDTTAKCVFHPIEPYLVGQDMSQFKDLDGRPVIMMIADVGKKPQPKESGWVFYLWEEPWKLPIPCWKSSYLRKAIAPDGIVYVVGSGLYNMKKEKAFIQEHVDMAAELIMTKGKDVAFAKLGDRSCVLHVLDAYITVQDSKGDIVVDPAFPTLTEKRNMSNFVDKTGRNITQEVVNGLKNKDCTWIMYIWPSGDANRLARHMLYVRKIKIDNEIFYVYADLVPATPIWMKR